jgi:adenine-specific DNA-methyltransferase
MRYEGRLELTWTNKGLRLLASDDGSYEWVDPADYRVAEVRLLHSNGVVGTVTTERNRAQGNLLIRGDALYGLTSLVDLQEFSRIYAGKVRLAYLDPPFNTQQSFLHYDDALEHSVWLTMMRDRLLSIRELLGSNGSVWVHLDDSELAYCKAMMDELFGRDNFVATVIWEKADSPRMDAALFSSRHDSILVYRKSDAWIPNRLPMDPNEMAHFNVVDGKGERYRRVLLRKWGANSLREDRPNLWYPLEAPDGTVVWPIRTDGAEGYWRWKRDKYEADKHLIEWVRQDEGWQPYVRQMARDATMRPPETIWFNHEVDSNRQAKQHIKALFPDVEPFATPKPERLLQRILHIGSDPGDIVLDCFVGSGTTAAVAHKMERRWVAIEREEATLSTYTIPRLTKVVEGADPGGISEAVEWEGGGGFRILDVAPSMFRADQGQVFLSEWATDGKLAEATAAQLHYEYEYDPPFTGRRGRSRLAVIDGLVNEGVVELLVKALPESERLVVCGTAVDPAARELLRSLRSGSTVRKIPQSILQDYRLAARVKQPLPIAGEPSPVAVPLATT